MCVFDSLGSVLPHVSHIFIIVRSISFTFIRTFVFSLILFLFHKCHAYFKCRFPPNPTSPSISYNSTSLRRSLEDGWFCADKR